MPEISVIIPVYNRPELLQEAAASVFTQTLKDYELLIVDDGSTDSTPEIAAELAASASAGGRCRVITTPHSGFPGASRNRGVEAASGRYIAFLDSDDTWLPEKLELQHKLMRGSGSRISHTREIWRRGEKTVSQKGQKHQREGDVFADALKKCIIGPSTVMMERSLFMETGGFHERIEIAEDYEYWLRISCEQAVDYLGKELTVKRAGGWPQLSEKYGRIEWFRLCALAGLLDVEIAGSPVGDGQVADGGSCGGTYLQGYEWDGFSDARRASAEDELIFKLGVWAAGCRKRKRDNEADRFDAIIESIGGSAQNEKTKRNYKTK